MCYLFSFWLGHSRHSLLNYFLFMVDFPVTGPAFYTPKYRCRCLIPLYPSVYLQQWLPRSITRHVGFTVLKRKLKTRSRNKFACSETPNYPAVREATSQVFIVLLCIYFSALNSAYFQLERILSRAIKHV